MTEQEWLECTDPKKMQVFMYGGEVSDRKLRLFAVACCRRIWHLLVDKRSRESVEVAERYADGRATDEELETASEVAYSVWDTDMEQASTEGKWDRESYLPYFSASAAAYTVAIPLGWWGGAPAFVPPDEIACEVSANRETESLTQCALLRDIFGNLFRPVTISPTWRTWNDATAVRIAQTVYDDRILPAGTLHNARLLILADALEEAGYGDEQILMHLRSGGEHYRGCWVIDLILGKQ